MHSTALHAPEASHCTHRMHSTARTARNALHAPHPQHCTHRTHRTVRTACTAPHALTAPHAPTEPHAPTKKNRRNAYPPRQNRQQFMIIYSLEVCPCRRRNKRYIQIIKYIDHVEDRFRKNMLLNRMITIAYMLLKYSIYFRIRSDIMHFHLLRLFHKIMIPVGWNGFD